MNHEVQKQIVYLTKHGHWNKKVYKNMNHCIVLGVKEM